MKLYLIAIKTVTPVMHKPFQVDHRIEAYLNRDQRDYWATEQDEDEYKVRVDLEIPGDIEDLFPIKTLKANILPLCTED